MNVRFVYLILIKSFTGVFWEWMITMQKKVLLILSSRLLPAQARHFSATASQIQSQAKESGLLLKLRWCPGSMGRASHMDGGTWLLQT